MNAVVNTLLDDIERINQISIVPTLLEVICRTTGMGFAAVARVTSDRWIACSVRDEINFGLGVGGELPLETTICNEIRASGKGVVINHVAVDEHFYGHHTPKTYGFQSYISIPIILHDGTFFGTLCAIDPQPADLNNVKIIGLFTAFAELIAFHLWQIDLLQHSNRTVQQMQRKVTETTEENQQYEFIAHHTLAEPLRKLRVFSSLIVSAAERNETEQLVPLARKIESSAQRFSALMEDITGYTNLSIQQQVFESLPLQEVLSAVCLELDGDIDARQGVLDVHLPYTISGVRGYLRQLFVHLVKNALQHTRPDVPPVIKISGQPISGASLRPSLPADPATMYVRIDIQDNGAGLSTPELKNIFQFFTDVTHAPVVEHYGIGLAYCRKIVRLHHGFITAHSTPGHGSTFTVILPAQAPADRATS